LQFGVMNCPFTRASVSGWMLGDLLTDAVQKAAGDQPIGDLFPAIHLVPRTVIEPGQPKEGVLSD
jgi:hypothetical protein